MSVRLRRGVLGPPSCSSLHIEQYSPGRPDVPALSSIQGHGRRMMVCERVWRDAERRERTPRAYESGEKTDGWKEDEEEVRVSRKRGETTGQRRHKGEGEERGEEEHKHAQTVQETQRTRATEHQILLDFVPNVCAKKRRIEQITPLAELSNTSSPSLKRKKCQSMRPFFLCITRSYVLFCDNLLRITPHSFPLHFPSFQSPLSIL